MPAQKYRLGPFLVHMRTRELFRDQTKLKLRPQAFQVLAVLLEKADDCVTREELQEKIWPGNKLVDAEHGLNTAIKELRACLGDSASKPRYIETLPKLGYRLLSPVEPLEEPAGESARKTGAANHHQAEIPNAAFAPAGPPTSRRYIASFAVAVAVIVATLVAVKSPWSRAAGVTQTPPPHSRVMLAVLPFENLTGDATQEYFSDGLTEEMISQLGRLDPQKFGVIARTSVMHYKRNPERMDQIARELGVQQILEGSVRREAGNVRINAQLIDPLSQARVWSREYNRDTTNLLGVQAEIAEDIANEIQASLGTAKTEVAVNKPTLTPQAYQAYDSYLKGLFFWNQRTAAGFQQAIRYFEDAIAKDPNYAPAYAGLANSYTLLTAYSASPPAEYMPKARAAAQRALEIDERLPEAHVARALILANYDWDWAASEKEYQRGIQLNPNYATAHHWFAELLAWLGRFDEAQRESELARQLDPLSLIIATDRGAIFYYARQYDRAIEQLRTVEEMDPKFARAHVIIYSYVERGSYPEAIADLEAWKREWGNADDAGWIAATEVYVYGRAGKGEKARAALAKLQHGSARRQLNPAALVLANLGVGDKNAALALLKKAGADHSNAMTALKVDPAYDPLRNDPRFHELLGQAGLEK